MKQSSVTKEKRSDIELHRGTFNNKILFEIVMIADTKLTRSKRESIQILDLLGEIGGFYEAAFVIVSLFGNYLSFKMLQRNLARSYYM